MSGNRFSSPVSTTILNIVLTAGRFTLFSLDFLRNLVMPPWNLNRFLDQGARIGVMSLPVATLTAMFTGMVMVLQIGVELARFGAVWFSAGITVQALTRELIPVFTSIVVGARVAAAMTAELGTMRVTEQLDAMTALSVRPMHYLVVPRVVMTTLMLPVVAIYSGFLGFLGGLLVGVQVLHIPAETFITTTMNWLDVTDVYTGLAKTVVFGLFIGLGGCYYGFHTDGGAEGVGHATTSSVVFVILMILTINFLLTTWFIFLFKTF